MFTKMKKIGLLFGLNYYGTSAQLNGCINDVLMMSNNLTNIYGYNEVRIFTDETSVKPTKQTIITEINRIIAESAKCSEIFIHYSGHGGRRRDTSGDEKDGYDEIIFPLDYTRNGIVSDDELWKMLSQTKCDLKIVMDCCHSGSMVDLHYSAAVYGPRIVMATEKKNINRNNKNILMISGCTDEQVSYDIYNVAMKKAMGALTSTFLEITEKFRTQYNTENIKIKDMMLAIAKRLKEKNYDQRPVFSSNNRLNLDSCFLSKNVVYQSA